LNAYRPLFGKLIMNTTTTPTPTLQAPTDKGSLLRPALVLFLLLSLLTGLAYPLLTAAIAKAVFPAQAEGSLLRNQQGQPIGARLIGQNFTDPGHFWGRPSATGTMPYNAALSGGSNQGPLNPALVDAVKARVAALRAADPGNTAPVPQDLVTASASGLDPHISPEAARYQAGRVARVRQLPVDQVMQLIERHTERPQLGVLGDARVNVLALNLALDSALGTRTP
jgi:K+-transporting ATPase ATPase C chain